MFQKSETSVPGTNVSKVLKGVFSMARRKKLISILLTIVLFVGTVQVFSYPVAKTEAATSGKWVLVGESHYAYQGKYASKQNSYYKYNLFYNGTTSDKYVRFSSEGGYLGPGTTNSEKINHDCSKPSTSYKPGASVALNIRLTLVSDTNPDWDAGGAAYAFIAKYGKSEYGDGYFNSSQGSYSDFTYYDKENDKDHVDVNVNQKIKTITQKVKTTMPSDPKKNERIAIIFVVRTAYDSWSSNKSSDYGGYMFYEWRYKFVPDKTVKPRATKITKINKKKTTATIRWKKVKKVKGYQLQVARNKKFTKGKVTFTKKPTKIKLVNFKKRTRYYFRVSTFVEKGKKKVYSKWSKVKSVKF